MTLGILGEQFAGGIKMRVFANAGENIQHLASVRLRVFHAVCGDERQLMRTRKLDQFAVNPFLAANEMPLKFDKNIFAAEDVDEEFGAMFRVLGSAGCQPVASGSLPDVLSVCMRRVKRCLRQAAANYRLAACAPQIQKRDQAVGKLRQLIPAHCAFAFFTAQMRLGQQFAQICVAGAIFDQHRQNAAVFH